MYFKKIKDDNDLIFLVAPFHTALAQIQST